MSALACTAAGKGFQVYGSDRSFDTGENVQIRTKLERAGVRIFPQDGSGIQNCIDSLVVSSAVEPSIADVAEALKRKIPIIKRAELLAEFFNSEQGIAVGGTSGKTTVTSMIGLILRSVGRDPSVVNGGMMLNSLPVDSLENVWSGNGNDWVIEADESDGSIELYKPKISLLTTVSLDHMPLGAVRPLFSEFLGRAKVGCAINADCIEAIALMPTGGHCVTFGESEKADFQISNVRQDGFHVSFRINDLAGKLSVPGHHNVQNAAAAVAACRLVGVEPVDSLAALEQYKGVRRRLQVVGKTESGATVIDDFAHNPEKITASLNALKPISGKLFVFFQPHGFGPVRMMKNEFIEAFNSGLRTDDSLSISEIFYTGGTVSRDVSSLDLSNKIPQSRIETRKQFRERIRHHADRDSLVVIMGARDNTLSNFAASLIS